MDITEGLYCRKFRMKSRERFRSLGSSQERDSGQEQEILMEQEEDSGCECSLEEIEKMERMDAWSKTLVAIRVLTEFKKRRKKTLEEEKAKRRKNLWRRMRLKLRIFNLFANKISSDDPAVDRILKLKRKLGKLGLYKHFIRSNLRGNIAINSLFHTMTRDRLDSLSAPLQCKSLINLCCCR